MVVSNRMKPYGIAPVARATLGCESSSGSAVVLKGLTMLPRLLRFAVLAATVASGLVLVVKPESVSGFTGLAPDAARGVTAVRAAMGGLFIALGLTPLFEANLALRQRPLGGRNLNLALLRYPTSDRARGEGDLLAGAATVVQARAICAASRALTSAELAGWPVCWRAAPSPHRVTIPP